jgi:hypothetical protein
MVDGRIAFDYVLFSRLQRLRPLKRPLMAQVRLTLREADDRLPDVCMVCGEAATTIKTQQMSYCPSWIGVTWILGGPLVYFIMARMLTKHASVQTPFCDAHQSYWFKRLCITLGAVLFLILFGVGGFFAVVLLAAGQRNESLGYYGLAAGVVLFLIFVIILGAIRRTSIRPSEITERDLLLVNVCQEFVDAIEEEDRDHGSSRRGRRRRDEDDEDDEDDYDEDRPRKKRPAMDEDDDERRPKKKRRTVDDDDDVADDRPRPRKKRRPIDDD